MCLTNLIALLNKRSIKGRRISRLKFKSSMIAFLLLFFCHSIAAKSNLLITEEFKVISVNGAPFTDSRLKKMTSLKLSQGINKIAIEYQMVFRSNGGNNFETVKSDIFVISFHPQSIGQYRLQYLKQTNSRAAKNFIRNPLVNIIDSQGKKVESSQFFPESQSFSSIHQITAKKIKPQQSIRLVSKAAIKKNNKPNSPQTDVEAMLLFWWQQANQQQRQSFLKKINQSN